MKVDGTTLDQWNLHEAVLEQVPWKTAFMLLEGLMVLEI